LRDRVLLMGASNRTVGEKRRVGVVSSKGQYFYVPGGGHYLSDGGQDVPILSMQESRSLSSDSFILFQIAIFAPLLIVYHGYDSQQTNLQTPITR
jgi:hypothetical protein